MDFCPELLDLIQTRRAIGQSGKVFENVWGHSTENNLVTLRALMREMNAQSALETGFEFGGACLPAPPGFPATSTFAANTRA
jgi:hypothetical protein